MCPLKEVCIVKRESDFRTISSDKSSSIPERRTEARAPDTIQSRTSEFGSIMSMLGSLERMVQETFRRPFFGWPMRDMFGQYGLTGDVGFHPLVDVYEEGNELIIRCELPGLSKENIEVTFTDENTLVISGERACDEKFEKGAVRRECSYGVFKRSLTLPEGCEPEKAKAEYKDGILQVHVPKSEQTRKGHSVKVE